MIEDLKKLWDYKKTLKKSHFTTSSTAIRRVVQVAPSCWGLMFHLHILRSPPKVHQKCDCPLPNLGIVCQHLYHPIILFWVVLPLSRVSSGIPMRTCMGSMCKLSCNWFLASWAQYCDLHSHSFARVQLRAFVLSSIQLDVVHFCWVVCSWVQLCWLPLKQFGAFALLACILSKLLHCWHYCSSNYNCNVL